MKYGLFSLFTFCLLFSAPSFAASCDQCEVIADHHRLVDSGDKGQVRQVVRFLKGFQFSESRSERRKEMLAILKLGAKVAPLEHSPTVGSVLYGIVREYTREFYPALNRLSRKDQYQIIQEIRATRFIMAHNFVQ